jgi:hypothetical protein
VNATSATGVYAGSDLVPELNKESDFFRSIVQMIAIAIGVGLMLLLLLLESR